MTGFDPIDLGVVADNRLGDDFRAGGVKINTMFSEIFVALAAASALVPISQESDFDVQDATTITLESNKRYFITADFSTAKRFIWKSGSSWTSSSIDGPTVTFTGSGTMFTGTNESFFMDNASIDPGIGNEAFALTDNLTHTSKLLILTVQVENCLRWGTFEGAQIIEVTNSNSPNAVDGCVFVGTDGILFSFAKFALTSTSATFKGIDLGSATATIIEFQNLFFVAPAGAFGISGLANNGNVPAGRLAMVSGSEFLGGITDLENISPNDTRWNFQNNTPTRDTFADALLSVRNNVTETVISTQDVPVIVNATWSQDRSSLFTITAGGRATYDAEKDLIAPIDIAAGVISSGGGGIDVTLYVAINGTIVTQSGIKVAISGSDAQTISIPWQEVLEEDDFVELFIENNTNTTNIIVEHATCRVR